MTIQSKQKVWRSALLAGFVVLVISSAGPASPLLLTAIAAWFLILGTLPFRWFRCPSCDRVAVPPAGLHILSAATRCRHCGNSLSRRPTRRCTGREPARCCTPRAYFSASPVRAGEL
jgi:hypothetical protein